MAGPGARVASHDGKDFVWIQPRGAAGDACEAQVGETGSFVPMALRKFVARLTKPVEELDRERIERFSDDVAAARTDEIVPRERARVAGEVRSVRIVPRAGAPSLEVTVYDGRGSVVGVFLGRRRIAGVSPGRKLVLEGMVGDDRGRLMIYNPLYELH
jgi:RecG-like helicase